MAVVLVPLPVSRGFQIKSLAEMERRKKCSSLILYGKLRGLQERYQEEKGSLKAGENSWVENKSLGQGKHHFQHD